ncbi:RNA polymerase sigma factor [Dyadobacter sp. CY326]|uniref:RNA polymerase sigma factor n=1 Tax=Dyadobacter sp. CY326 TaxID=2907300 RepID=UPI001F47C10A|nr:sigma-70 family RNA polymerase sigma factor [Dyadobacter sp. CY326]MCE7067714.1 sigma-70 family RNA polymerase sigma factor [Dyadobacter sp. CY326]
MIEGIADCAWHNCTDEKLVKLFLKTGENRYFEILYDRYSFKVFQKCFTITRDAGIAEDLTHDIFLKLVNKLDTFKKDAKFSTWLFSVTYNHCMDLIRSNKKKIVTIHRESADGIDHMNLDEMFGVEEVNTKILRLALERLNPEEKTLLYMKYMDDRSIRYIAGSAQLTESAVKMRLMRSREKLRRAYLEIAYLAKLRK